MNSEHTDDDQADSDQEAAIQNLVHAIAEDLGNGRKKSEVVQDLIDNGWDQAEAADFVNRIESNQTQSQADHKDHGSGMGWLVWIGILLFVNLLSYLFDWSFWIY